MAFAIITPLWIALDVLMLHPRLMTSEETGMDRFRWVSIPLLATVFFFSYRFLMAEQKSLTRANQIRLQAEQKQHLRDQENDAKGRREYVLEVIGLGVSLDKYRQGKLWDVLHKQGPYTSIREQDPKQYAWTGQDKDGVSGGRLYDAFENGAERTPMYWGGPSFYAGASISNPEIKFSPINPMMGLAGETQSTGMALLWSSNFGHDDRLACCHFPFVDGGRQIAQC
ncbi:DUF2875 family protein [Rugamonas sp. CCM 8940]|uniref:type VI lipase adapter Tla3 domain-containing protein n=1 Tax=Rugamonas sp. CCM 8940 TaxID=2765359 RepID=UPI0018F7791B|nr:DUF2875 family protein [Rugamonas sp. CCM 8940]MBJ7313885.1 DUF2875 family protein [Rugamonas sp. CCM 8940]